MSDCSLPIVDGPYHGHWFAWPHDSFDVVAPSPFLYKDEEDEPPNIVKGEYVRLAFDGDDREVWLWFQGGRQHSTAIHAAFATSCGSRFHSSPTSASRD